MSSEAGGVIVLGHGSRYAQGRAVIEETAARYQAQHPEWVVAHAFVEMAEPQLEDAIAALVAQELERIVVVPLFLSFGHHIAEDLPRRMAAAQATYPSVNFVTTAPIGADPLLCEIIQARITASAADADV